MLAGLPGSYAPPRGRLLLARIDGAQAGCVALRPHDAQAGKMKRLHVRAGYQGAGLGALGLVARRKRRADGLN